MSWFGSENGLAGESAVAFFRLLQGGFQWKTGAVRYRRTKGKRIRYSWLSADGGHSHDDASKNDKTMSEFANAHWPISVRVSWTINRNENCESCRGTGAEPGTSPKTCPTCNGSGQVRVQRQTPLGSFVSTSTCDRCGGKGTIVETPCSSCSGRGKVRKTRKIKVNVPAGVDTGNVMPLRGQGEHGSNDGPPGDLYIRINVAKSKQFDRRGNDIYIETHISMGRAALGVEITVPTVDGDVKYTIPAGTQSGTMFRLKGKGVPKVHSNTRGDQYVKVIVDTPKNLNSKQKEALEAFMEACGESVDGEVTHKKGFKDLFNKK